MKFPLTLEAGTLVITNGAKTEQIVNAYVMNKDSIPVTIPASGVLTVKTLSAGETCAYLTQLDTLPELTYTFTAAV